MPPTQKLTPTQKSIMRHLERGWHLYKVKESKAWVHLVSNGKHRPDEHDSLLYAKRTVDGLVRSGHVVAVPEGEDTHYHLPCEPVDSDKS